MCARYSLRASNPLIADLFSLEFETPIVPRHNIAPTQNVLALRDGGYFEPAWGLVPSWAKDISIRTQLINARSETASEKPSFREAWRKRRCLVPADGFFEWRIMADGKQPFHIRHRDQAPFAMAGLWEIWESGEELLETCTILTTYASPFMSELHDRMPVILEPADFELWLDHSDFPASALQGLMQPYENTDLEMVPVTRSMSNSRFEDPSCTVPCFDQQSLF